MKIFKLDIFFWIMLLAFASSWYFLEDKVMWQSIFLITLGVYLFLSFIIRAVILQSIKENQQEISFSDAMQKQKQWNTSTWVNVRAIIVTYHSVGKVMDNGNEVGKLFAITVQVDKASGGSWRTLIKDVYVPITHLNSFGKNTEVQVLYNPENRYKEIIFENNNWHFEVKK
jgi:hypothetical protein